MGNTVGNGVALDLGDPHPLWRKRGGEMSMSSPSPVVVPPFDADLVRRAVADLHVNEREVIILTEFCGYTPHAAAQALGLSEETVLARLCTGYLRLNDSTSVLAAAEKAS
jgi:DNA-directed RNA polymerase specialized sigma24 family protein